MVINYFGDQKVDEGGKEPAELVDVVRDEGLVEMRRGRGVTVRATDSGRARVVEKARELLSEARRHGLKLSELKNLLEELA